jgi:hypothetical protein
MVPCNPYRTRVGHDRAEYAATGEQATMNAHLSVVAQWSPPQWHRGDPDSRSSTDPPGSPVTVSLGVVHDTCGSFQ